MEFVIVLGCLGAIFASFLNALAYRLNTSEKIENIWCTPSHCESCKRQLRWYDMIPVLSYLVTWGRCSQCGQPIFWYYPLSETFLIVSFTAFAYHDVSYLSFLILLFLFFLSYFDVVSKSIPKDITDIFFIISMAYAVIQVYLNFTPLLLITIILAFVLFALGFLANRKKEIFGLGDVIVLTSIILLSGLKTGILTIAFTILIAGIFAICLVIANRRNMKKYIPLIPFITLAYAISVIVLTVHPSFIDILTPLW